MGSFFGPSSSLCSLSSKMRRSTVQDIHEHKDGVAVLVIGKGECVAEERNKFKVRLAAVIE